MTVQFSSEAKVNRCGDRPYRRDIDEAKRGRFLSWSVPARPLPVVLHKIRLRPRTRGICKEKEVGCDHFSLLRKIEVSSSCGDRPYLYEGGCGCRGVGSCIRRAKGKGGNGVLVCCLWPLWRRMLALLFGPAGAWRRESSPCLRLLLLEVKRADDLHSRY